MNLSYSQIKHALSLDQDGLDTFAQELGMSLGELNEHLDLAEQGVGLNDEQYDSLYNKPQLSNEYKELEKMIVLLGDTISEKQWGLFADQARSLPANELHSMLNDDRFIGMYSYLSEICAERGIY